MPYSTPKITELTDQALISTPPSGWCPAAVARAGTATSTNPITHRTRSRHHDRTHPRAGHAPNQPRPGHLARERPQLPHGPGQRERDGTDGLRHGRDDDAGTRHAAPASNPEIPGPRMKNTSMLIAS